MKVKRSIRISLHRSIQKKQKNGAPNESRLSAEKTNDFNWRYNEILHHSPTLNSRCAANLFRSHKNWTVRCSYITMQRPLGVESVQCLHAYKHLRRSHHSPRGMVFFSRFLLFHITLLNAHSHTHTRTHTVANYNPLHYEPPTVCTQIKRRTWSVNSLSFVCIGYFTFLFSFFFFSITSLSFGLIKNTHVQQTHAYV